MKFKAGDRVHVTRLDGDDVDFYATLQEFFEGRFRLINCTDRKFVGNIIRKSESLNFGFNDKDYYTLAIDEEDTDKPEIQSITDTSDYELKIGDWIQYVAVNGEDRFGKVVGFQRNMDEQQIYMNLSLMNGNTDSIPKKWDWIKTRPNEAFLLDGAYNNLKSNAPCNRLERRTNNVDLDDEYIIEAKKGLYVREVTPNYYFKFTKDINKADVYEYKNAAIRHAEFVDGRVLNLKRYVEE